MKKALSVTLLILLAHIAVAQQYALSNTRTLFDAFENPSQKAFQIDSSKKYAFNFFIPNFSSNISFTGPAQSSFQNLVFLGKIGKPATQDDDRKNKLLTSSNLYLLMFKLYKDVRFNKEIGFAWQVKHDGVLTTTNETFTLFHNARNFRDTEYLDIFNNEGRNQAYHQFSFTYREDYNKRIGLGVKLSLLSGIAYNSFAVNKSEFNYNPNTQEYFLDLEGKARSSFAFNKVEKQMVYPLFKNPGVSFSASANFKLKNGWFLMSTVKDLGVIKWSKKSFEFPFSSHFQIQRNSASEARKRIFEEIKTQIEQSSTQKGYATPTNAKTEILLNKDFGPYQPNLIIAKSLFYPGGEAVAVHHYKLSNFVISGSTGYNFNNFFQLGAQLLYKTPNFELFAGSDQLFPTYQTTKNALTQTSTPEASYTSASVYFGLGLKFGPVKEHPLNSRSMPGVENHKHTEAGLFKRFFASIGRIGKKKK